MLDRIGPDVKRSHFMITLKEKTFECLASSLVVDHFAESFEDAFTYVIRQFNEH